MKAATAVALSLEELESLKRERERLIAQISRKASRHQHNAIKRNGKSKEDRRVDETNTDPFPSSLMGDNINQPANSILSSSSSSSFIDSITQTITTSTDYLLVSSSKDLLSSLDVHHGNADGADGGDSDGDGSDGDGDDGNDDGTGAEQQRGKTYGEVPPEYSVPYKSHPDSRLSFESVSSGTSSSSNVSNVHHAHHHPSHYQHDRHDHHPLDYHDQHDQYDHHDGYREDHHAYHHHDDNHDREELEQHKRILHLEHALQTLTNSHSHLKHQYSAIIQQHEAVVLQSSQQIDNYRTQIDELTIESANFKSQVDSERAQSISLRAQVTTLQQLLIDEQSKCEAAATKLQHGSKITNFFSTLPLMDVFECHVASTGAATPSPTLSRRSSRSTQQQQDIGIELVKTKAHLIKAQHSTQSLSTTLSKLQAAHEALKEQSRAKASTQQIEIAQLRSHLGGASRYIQWLVHHHKEITSSLLQKDLYIKKIENKLLVLAKQNVQHPVHDPSHTTSHSKHPVHPTHPDPVNSMHPVNSTYPAHPTHPGNSTYPVHSSHQTQPLDPLQPTQPKDFSPSLEPLHLFSYLAVPDFLLSSTSNAPPPPLPLDVTFPVPPNNFYGTSATTTSTTNY